MARPRNDSARAMNSIISQALDESLAKGKRQHSRVIQEVQQRISSEAIGCTPSKQRKFSDGFDHF